LLKFIISIHLPADLAAYPSSCHKRYVSLTILAIEIQIVVIISHKLASKEVVGGSLNDLCIIKTETIGVTEKFNNIAVDNLLGNRIRTRKCWV
jgi:hypothetical protein